MKRLPQKSLDYRYVLANERTFLAWIRTALGFLITSVGVTCQLIPKKSFLFDLALVLFLLFTIGISTYSYLRWLKYERNIRKKNVRYNFALLVIIFSLNVMTTLLIFAFFYISS